MNTRIKIICILIAICYVGLFVNIFYNDLDSIKESFIDGANSARGESVTTLFISLQPLSEENSNVVLSNKADNKPVDVNRIKSEVKVHVPTKDMPGHLFAIEMFCMVIGCFLAIAFLAFPFIFFNVIYNITKNKIITDSVILKIRIMGWIMTIFFLTDTLMRFTNIETAKYLINIENYKIKGLDLEANIIYLCLGLVTLLLAEILKVSLNLKKDQDLTI